MLEISGNPEAIEQIAENSPGGATACLNFEASPVPDALITAAAARCLKL